MKGDGPLRKMFQTASSMAFTFLRIPVAIKNENVILSFSKRPLDTFVKIILVMLSIRIASRLSIVSACGLALIALTKSDLTNCSEF